MGIPTGFVDRQIKGKTIIKHLQMRIIKNKKKLGKTVLYFHRKDSDSVFLMMFNRDSN